MTVGLRILERGGALLALKQELHAAEAALHLPDAGDNAHRVEDVWRRLVGVVALGHGKDEAVAFQRRFDGPQRARPTGRDRGRKPRENDGAPKGENRKCLTCAHLYPTPACRCRLKRGCRLYAGGPANGSAWCKGRTVLSYDI
jgi:hypothetical protein